MTDVLNSFMNKKNAESVFVSLNDGESIRVKRLTDIKMITKAGFGGEEKEVLRLVCDVDTSEGIRSKQFDNGTARFAKELMEKKVTIGSSFTITRQGMQVKTRYLISEVSNPVAGEHTIEQAAALAAPTTPSPIDEGAAQM